MKKFEYKIVCLYHGTPDDKGDTKKDINALGKQGWELVGFESVKYIFKREIS